MYTCSVYLCTILNKMNDHVEVNKHSWRTLLEEVHESCQKSAESGMLGSRISQMQRDLSIRREDTQDSTIIKSHCNTALVSAQQQ